MKKTFIFLVIILTLSTVPMLVAVGQTQSGSLPVTGDAAPPLQILATTADTLTARFTLPALKITTRTSTTDGESGGVETDIRFAGADRTLDIGKPRLPIYTQRIGIPVVGTPVVTIIQARSEIKTIENVGITPDDPVFPTLASDGTPRASTKFYPTQLVEVIPGGFVRDQRIGSLQINPVQYNQATQQLKIFPSVTFRVHFPGAVIGGAAPTASFSVRESPRVFEDLFQGTLRNYEQSKLWRKQRRGPYGITDGNHAAGAPSLINASTRRFKIPVIKTDMYRITYNNIRAHTGIEPETIDLDTLRLESSGRKQGVYIFDENENNTFDPGEQIVFYGRALADNKFTDENVYWLRFGLRGEQAVGLEASRVTEQDGTPKTPNLVSPKAFLTRVRFEENRHHDALDGTDVKSELADHYFGVAFRGGDIGTRGKDFPIYPEDIPGALPRLQVDGTATLRIRFQGVSRRGSARHVARITFNNHRLGRDAEWKRQAPHTVTRDIEKDDENLIFHNTTNYMRIEAFDDNDTPPGSYDFYLDWYELEYWRDFQAESNRLEFNTNTEPLNRGQVQYRVGNFFNETIDVYALDENGITSRLTGGKVTPRGASHRILFEDTVNQHKRYFAISRSSYKSINALVPTPPTPLRNPANRVDYIVITHSTFAESILPLVEFRRSQGLTTMVVDIDDIYNEFSDGLFNPFAIQKFLRYAYHNYQQPAPTYVLLIGDAHYDYKGATDEIYRRDPTFRGIYPNFVPTYHGWAPASGETSMDQRFVNISGDDPLPDMLIGRLSVQTPEALTTMVEKIIDYEKNPKIGVWQGTLIQVADDHTDKPNDGIFEDSRDELIQEVIPPGYDTREIYLRKIGSPNNTRLKILSAINRGALAIEYAGHGGSQTWADESIFRIEDAAGLRNQHLPFVITTTCLNGQFDKPQQAGSFCLSEQFLLGKYGAIGALSATRLTFGRANAEFDIDLFEALFRVVHESPELAGTKSIPLQPTIGYIVADAKISFLNRIRSTDWIPGTESYTLFGDPASRLARPQLDVKVELERIALNNTHKIVMKANEIGVIRNSGIAGTDGVSFTRASDFSTDTFSAIAVFANNFDDNLRNDITQRVGGNVWQGEYGTVRINVPNNALPGGGIARIFAYDDTYAAVGGTRFWIDTPVVQDIRETLDTKITDTLSISVLVLDDKGPGGIRSISVLWDNTSRSGSVDVTTPMVTARAPLGDVPQGGQWYELQTPIPLPKGGLQIRYQIHITDSTGHKVIIPSKDTRNVVNVPEGPNLAIGTDKADRAPIRYAFDEKKNAYQLVAELINNGLRPVLVDIEVVFAAGNPDADGDYIVDADADILGTVVVKPTEWVEGTYVWQRATAILDLKIPLETGVHKVYAMVDPEDPSIEDKIYGNLDEAHDYDNKQHVSFIVNDFIYRQEALPAFSLDRVFDIHFPSNALESKTQNTTGIPLAVTSQSPMDPTQPDLHFAPIPRVAALRRGLIRQGRAVAQSYEAAFRTGASALAKPAEIKFRFDVSALEDIVREEKSIQPDNPTFAHEFAEVTNQLAIYAWQANVARTEPRTHEDRATSTDSQSEPATQEANVSLSAWRRLPSKINYTPEGRTENATPIEKSETRVLDSFLLENYVTPVQMENASQQKLETDAISINPNLTPPGTWVIIFLDANEYEVFLKPKGLTQNQKLDKTGQLDNPFREEAYGLELRIPRQENPSLDVNYAFEFGDILAFETDRDPQGDVVLTRTWNANLGNGNATVVSRLGPKAEFETGDWFLFFTDPNYYELRDTSNEPSYHPNGVKIRGKINEPIFLSHLGFEVLVTASSEEFGFGDKIKFSTARVATITTEVTELTRFALMRSTDSEPPTFNLWVDGLQPQTGSVIAPRPAMSILLQDPNGIDTEFFAFEKQKDGGPFETITDYELRTQGGIQTVPIDYRPILFPGEYTFNIRAQDFNGNTIGGDDGIVSYRFFVIEAPDIAPPTIDIQVRTNTDEMLDEPLTDGAMLTEQPRFKITLTDDSALDETTFRFNFGSLYEALEPLDVSNYTQTFDPATPANAEITYAPDLANGEYQLQITAADTSENIAEFVTTFTLNEKVTLSEVFNVPNPVDRTFGGKTFFTYHLAQSPDAVTIKIYSVNGRLLKTLDDVSANRGTNETGWDCRDEAGVRCANGVYFYRVIADTENGKIEQVGKLAILR
ncbi:MAG: C25 family cysteine peptidase [Candidatus Poribacteria bacterium]|nr:C25 family cysteine peptidase [Candidatus Poribacteria bacterium]